MSVFPNIDYSTNWFILMFLNKVASFHNKDSRANPSRAARRAMTKVSEKLLQGLREYMEEEDRCVKVIDP